MNLYKYHIYINGTELFSSWSFFLGNHTHFLGTGMGSDDASLKSLCFNISNIYNDNDNDFILINWHEYSVETIIYVAAYR